MEKKRPQLNLDELYQLKWLLGGSLVLLSVWTVFYLELDAWTMMGLTTLAVGLVMARPAWPALVPGWVHRLAFPAIVAFFVGDLYLTAELLPAIVRLDILLLLYRGITYRKRRDDLQIIVLGLFLIVVAGVLTVSLVFAVQIIAFTACALAFLLVITLVDATTPPTTAVEAATTAPGWTRVAWRRLLGRVVAVLDWRVVTLGGLLFVGVVGLSALLFLAIPRFQLENSLFLERFMTKKARTGFSDNIKFGDVTDIQQDNSVALSVDVSDPEAVPTQIYWRMVVLDEYRENSFRISPALRAKAFQRERTQRFLLGQAPPRKGEAVYWTFYLESGVSRYLPLPGPFWELRFVETQNFRLAPSLGLVALRDEPVTMTAYRVENVVTSNLLAEPDILAGKVPQTELALREPDRAKLQQLVAELTGGAELGAEEFSRRAKAWLGRQHGYSLQSHTPAGSGDPLVRWMFSTAPGHCELFAGSFVLLARAAGYPARLVTGFKGGSWNAFSKNFTLRNSDAHAWGELYDAAARGWRRADPTPGAIEVSAADPAAEAARRADRIDRSWAARFDSLRVFWYRRIVNFDQRTQMETFKAVKNATQESGRRLRAKLDRFIASLKEWLKGPWDTRRVAVWLGVLAAIAGVVWAGKNYRFWLFNWGIGRHRRGDTHDPVRRLVGRWLVRLRDLPVEPELREDLQRLRFGAAS
nr:DUF3488 domain-containing protein [Opitutaceae bacterium]